MAAIRETLVLEDKFTKALTEYIKLSDSAATSTKALKTAVNQVTTAAKVNISVSNEAAAAAKAQLAQLKLQDYQQRAVDASATSLTETLKKLAGAYASIQGIKGLLNLSDTLVSTNARLDMMNDGLQTTAELNDMIYQSAMRARGSYVETAAFVSKLGNLAGEAFDSNKELVAFAEQVNKQIALSGASSAAVDAAMLQLTQGLSSGALRGEELNSVLEQTPMIAKTIANYMGVTTGEMRELASEGAVTAEIVKNAMLSAAEETNAAFESMPMTWSQVFTMAGNIAIRALQPVLTGINWLANNIETIGPLVLGLAGAFAVFQIAAHWTQIAAVATAAYQAVVTLLSIGYGVLTGSTAAASAATFAFNSALLASPITWVVMIIMLAVGAFYALIAVINKAAGTSISATGIIFGVFYALGASILNNTIIPLQRGFATFANFIGNIFTHPIAAIKVLFYDMALTVLGYVKNIAHGLEDLISNIPWVSVNLTSGIDSLYNKVSNAATEAKTAGEWKEYVKAWDYKDVSDAFSSGYEKGSNFSISDLFSTDASDYSSDLSDIASYTGDTAANTKSIAKAVNMAEEDIRSLVDVAERRYVNNINFTSKSPVIQVTGQNTGNTAADRQNLADTLRDILVEQLASGSVRTTARAVPG